MAIDADQVDYRGLIKYSWFLTIELGNLVLGDYEQPLHDLVSKVARTKEFLQRAQRGRQGDMEVCIEPAGGSPACNYDPGNGGPIEISLDEVPSYNSTVRVLSHAWAPRYVAVYFVDTGFGVQRLSIKGHEHGDPIASGGSVETTTISAQGNRNGKYRIVALWSKAPFNADTLYGDLSWVGISGTVVEHRDPVLQPTQIGGGFPVGQEMAPWMAQLYSTIPYTTAEKAADLLKPPDQQEHLNDRSDAELNHRCGGTLIEPTVVVTAAHCVAQGKYAGDGMAQVLVERRIRLGSKWLGKEGETFAIGGIAVPADYDPETEQNDIALLLLTADRDTWGMQIPNAIAIGSEPLAPGTPLTTYGWGFMGEVASGGDPLFDLLGGLQHNPLFLRYGKLASLDWTACHDRMSLLTSGMVCAVAPDVVNGGSSEHNVFTCRGDSGGPLVRTVNGQDELVGITSWSMGCGYLDYASVFTDVTKYGAWISAARQMLVPGALLRVPEPMTAGAEIPPPQ
jgi:hypothetical protein